MTNFPKPTSPAGVWPPLTTCPECGTPDRVMNRECELCHTFIYHPVYVNPLRPADPTGYTLKKLTYLEEREIATPEGLLDD